MVNYARLERGDLVIAYLETYHSGVFFSASLVQWVASDRPEWVERFGAFNFAIETTL